MQKLYNELANWWPILSRHEDYAEEVEFFIKVLSESGLPANPSLLELGSGGGNNAFYLKQTFNSVTLTDLSPHMLAVSRTLNPDCEHVQGDMRTVRLDRQFDVVFVHDAIDYMLTLQDMRQAFETAYLHCRPGGVALFVPDHVRETFEPDTDHGGHDGEGRALRYIEWSYDPDPNDTTYLTDYVYLLREGDQSTQVEHDQHTCGLFPRADWLRLLSDVGFETTIVPDPFGRDVFVARKR